MMKKLIEELMAEYTENYRLTGKRENQTQRKVRINGQNWIIRINVIVIH